MNSPAASAMLDEALRTALGGGVDGRVIVGFSGGADSTALLAAVAGASQRWLTGPVLAFHFDHRLHPASGAWLTHCGEVCAQLGVPLRSEAASGEPPPGASVEAWARDARYEAVARGMRAGDVVLTAHHREDLAETLLLMMFRGSGPHGLAGIAPRRPLGAGTLLRPFLDLPRSVLESFLAGTGLAWLEDPANEDARFDRNFVRRSLLPLVAERWSGAAANLARAARLQRAAAEMLDEVADAALAACASGEDRLPIAPLLSMPEPRRSLVLRRWLHGRSGQAPDAGTLMRTLSEVIGARCDRNPMLRWAGGELRRHGGCVHWLPASPPPPLASALPWQADTVLALPGGVLEARAVTGTGLRASLVADGTLTVHARRGGELIRPAGSPRRRPVKHLLQEWGIPPWQRHLLPFVYAGDELAAIADLAVASEFAATPGEAGLQLVWRWSDARA